MRHLPFRLLLAGALLLPGVARAEEKPLDPKVRDEVVLRAREYFNPEEDSFRGRTCLRAALQIASDAGFNVLARLNDVRDFVYQGRSFLQPYSDKKWQKDAGIEKSGVIPGKGSPTAVSIKSDRLRLTYSVPKAYKDKEFPKYPRPAPYPLLFSLHTDEDYKLNNQPGDDMMVRRYGSPAYKDVLDTWLVLAPVAARGRFIEDGLVKVKNVTEVLGDFVKRYHVDFDRVILDGDAAALAVAASQSAFYAGIVLRGGEADAKLVPNFAPVPVYVVGCPPLADALRAAGHPDVTCGDDAGAAAWMAARKRVTPKSFEWRAQAADQVLAHWVNLDVLDWGGGDRTMKVEVVDTADEPNTIRITARGIEKISLFLNDEVVDLDREVRIVVNGHEERKEKFVRSLDRLFDKDPMRARKTMYFGYLFPVLVDNVSVNPPAEADKPVTPDGGKSADEPATEAQEVEAALLRDKAKEAEDAGELKKAITLYDRALKVGNTTLKGELVAKLEALRKKVEGNGSEAGSEPAAK
jgi:hypothetical protein